ncbi:MAG: hypothetical protein A6F71_05650 [Cycloclasticus sp. symbiont of Poecilosclerida sp. M]|nr:MAG: hypothetical protein A6F71_05650 [Cycloclasticus sp. symbiont of Poecilosclerida sp. M]
MADTQYSTFSLALLHPKYWFAWFMLSVAYGISWLPIRVRHIIGKGVGFVTFLVNRKRRIIVNTNLELCFPEFDEAQRKESVKEHFSWYGRALIEYSFLFFASKKRLYKQVIFEGKEHIDNALKENKNIMILLGHSVFLEFATITICRVYKVYGSYKPLSNPVINWILARSREKHMLFTIAREEGLMRLVRELKDEQMLGFLPDEDHGKKYSDFAPFFGVQKATLNTPTRIAKLANAVRLPTLTFFDEELGKYKVIVGQAIDCDTKRPNEEHAKAMNLSYEKMIRQYPMQYMWLLRLFKTQPDSAEKRY